MNIKIKFLGFFLVLMVNTTDAISLKSLINKRKFPEVSDGVLDLSNLKLTDIKGIESYPGIEDVETLIIKDNKIASLNPLLSIAGMNLKKLDATGNKIIDVAVLAFFTLEEIVLDSNKIDNKNLNILLSLDSITHLGIDLNPIYDATYKAFVKTGLRNGNYIEFLQELNNLVEDVEEKSVAQVDNDEDLECAICYNKNNVILTPCNHAFHDKCLNIWKGMGKNSCPMCRQNLS